MTPTLYPLRFTPVYKDYVWGGTRIPEQYARGYIHGICAESWDLSDRPEGMSKVSNGAMAGRPLRELVERLGPRLVGTAAPAGPFPLLVKIIDAREKLSVQVHPNNRNAAACGGEPKTEVWYILDGGPETFVYAGFAEPLTPERFRAALDSGDMDPVLRRVPAQTGDTIFIPGGRIHAIAEGNLLLEVQQNSNTTYRVYDWGRMGKDGAPRDLHLDDAFQVLDWNDCADPRVPAAPLPQDTNRETILVECPWFRMTRLDLFEEAKTSNDGTSFHALFVASGSVTVTAGDGSETLAPGTTCLVPADLDTYTLTPAENATLIRATLGSG